MPRIKPQPEDDLLRLARRQGVHPDHVRQHEDNRDLLATRSAHLLHEGDELLIPDEPPEPCRVESGKTHVLVYAPPERVLELQLLDDDDKPICADYALTEIEYDDTALGDEPSEVHGYAHEGLLVQVLPAAALRAKLTIEGQGETITLELGHLDPVTKRKGLMARLAQLGLYMGPLDETHYDARLAHAVRVFQRECGLPVTGHADLATRDALVNKCGA